MRFSIYPSMVQAGMPRKARIDAPGCLHQIICRGIERRKIFRNDMDWNRFVESVLALAEEDIERKYKYQAKGYDLDAVIEKASEEFEIAAEEITEPGKHSIRIQARSVAAY